MLHYYKCSNALYFTVVMNECYVYGFAIYADSNKNLIFAHIPNVLWCLNLWTVSSYDSSQMWFNIHNLLIVASCHSTFIHRFSESSSQYLNHYFITLTHTKATTTTTALAEKQNFCLFSLCIHAADISIMIKFTHNTNSISFELTQIIK